PSQTSKTISVTVNGDTTVESDEIFLVSLSNPVNAAISNGLGAGTIVNDDALPALSINNVRGNEANSFQSNFNFTVTLSPTSAQSVTVQYATSNGTAAAGSDYTSASGTLTFN